MKRLLFVFSLGLIVFSCGEAGLQVAVGKTVEYSFEVTGLGDLQEITPTSAAFISAIAIDIASDDLGEYQNDLEEVSINFIRLRFDDYDGNATFRLVLDGDNGIGTLVDFPDQNIINGSELNIFPGSVNITSIQQMESLILGAQQFRLDVDAAFNGNIDSDFKITMIFDIDALAKP